MPLVKTTKSEIVAHAKQVFTKQGYHKTTMNDIAEACGILKGSLYHHFKSKEELMLASIAAFHYNFNVVAKAIKEKQNLNLQEKLKQIIDFSEKTYLADEGSMMANIVLETINVVPQISESIKIYFTERIAFIANLLEEFYKPEDALKIAKESCAAVEGAVMMMQIFKDESFLKRVHEGLRRKVEADINQKFN